MTDWDGEKVFFECRWISSTGRPAAADRLGLAVRRQRELPWNLEWAAQWSLFGVTIEPCGKDLATAGGSRERSDAIAREVFEREPPINVPYEFLNIGGKKMSTSKGTRRGRPQFTEVVPAEQLASCSCDPDPDSAIDFDPRAPTPSRACSTSSTGSGPPPPDATSRASCLCFAPIFRYALLDPEADVELAAAPSGPPFAHLAMLVQIPGVDVAARAAAEKGVPLDRRGARRSPRGRGGGRRSWLDLYAPDVRGSGPPGHAAGGGRPAAPGSSAGSSRARRCRRRRRAGDRRGLAGGHLRRRGRPRRSTPRPRSKRSISPSSAARTAPAPAGCWRTWSRTSSIGRLREAAAEHGEAMA